MNRIGLTIAAVAALCSTLTPGANAAAQDDGVAGLLQQTRNALGAAALDRGGILALKGTVVAGGLPGTTASSGEVGGARFAEHSVTPPLAAGDGWDGAAAWNSDQSGLVWVDGSDAGRSQEIDSAYAANDAIFANGSGGASVTAGGRKTDKGRSYDVVVATPPKSRLPMQIWLDAATHLPARYVVSLGPVDYTTTVSGYRSVDGLMVPFRERSESSTGNVSETTVTSAAIESPGDVAALAQPKSDVHDFSIANGATSTTVPIEVIDNHVYLDVRLNGKGPYRFIFDTGGANLIDPGVAKELGAASAGSIQGGGAGSTTESFSFAKVDTLQSGDAVVRDQVFLVVPVRQGFGVAAGQHVDGLIGFEMLARFVTTFDYAGRSVTFRMPGAALPQGAHDVPFVFGGTQPQFACTIDGIATQCSVDTGARDAITLIAPFVAAHPQIVPAQHSAIGVNGFGVGGGARGFLGRLQSLQIDDLTLPDLIADFSTQTGGFFAQPFLAANVGGGVWKRFTVTFDYPELTMALQPNASFGMRDQYERAGLFLIATGGAIVVYDVRPQTPAADAGIVKGDRIVAIDGKPPASLQAARDLFLQPAGTVLHVEVAGKDGATRTVTLTLRDWV
ncbi:MAG TPA: aspartyl protease family protein [Candidatus Acidoferrales bacterium]|nr:aspartyl protease family protein [Candidatus Acidoferrales bacterium]